MSSDSLPRLAPAPTVPMTVPKKPASCIPPPRSLSADAAASSKAESKAVDGSGPGNEFVSPPAAGASNSPLETLFEPHSLFIANLPQGSTDSVLRQALNYHFGRFGSVVSVKIKREKDVRPVDPRKKEGDVWAWLSFATPEQAMTALHGAQGIRVLGRTLRVERAKAHRVILLEPREGATFVPSTIGGWLVRTSTGDFDVSETFGRTSGTPSIEARRKGEGLLIKFGQGEGSTLLERLNANPHLSASIYIEDHAIGSGPRPTSNAPPSSTLRPATLGFGSTERGRTRYRQGAPAARSGRLQDAQATQPVVSPDQTPRHWPGLRIAIPTPPRFRHASPLRCSTSRRPTATPASELLLLDPMSIGFRGNDAFRTSPALDPFEDGRTPTKHVVGHVHNETATFDGPVNAVPAHFPTGTLAALQATPFTPFLPSHWPFVRGSLPASPDRPWPYAGLHPVDGARPRGDSPGWIHAPRTSDPAQPFWPNGPFLAQSAQPVPADFFFPFRPSPFFSNAGHYGAFQADGPASHDVFPLTPPAPPFWLDNGSALGPVYHTTLTDLTFPLHCQATLPSAPRSDWRTDADGQACDPLVNDSILPHAQSSDAFSHDALC